MVQNKAQLYQDGIQECCFLKSKILGAEQMKDACLPAATSINASDRQVTIRCKAFCFFFIAMHNTIQIA
jgi:hypothetical protein